MNTLDSDPGAIMAQLLLIFLLTSINAFFASAEMAIVSVNKSKVRKLSEEGNCNAKLLEKLLKNQVISYQPFKSNNFSWIFLKCISCYWNFRVYCKYTCPTKYTLL